MGIYETTVRTAWRAMMRVAEHRIDQVAELGRPLAKTATAADAPPVLLVHGYGNSSAAFGAYERSLARDGFRAFSIDLPSFGFGDIHADARVVGAKVDEIRALTGAAKVDVVGHSRGGLVSRLAKQVVDEEGGIRRVVTLSSANQGLFLGPVDGLAAPMLPAGMKQIRRGASLIDELHATRGTHDLVAVGTNGVDGVLVPASATRIERAPFHPVDEGRTIGPLSRVGHYGILRDDIAYETVRGALLTR